MTRRNSPFSIKKSTQRCAALPAPFVDRVSNTVIESSSAHLRQFSKLNVPSLSLGAIINSKRAGVLSQRFTLTTAYLNIIFEKNAATLVALMPNFNIHRYPNKLVWGDGGCNKAFPGIKRSTGTLKTITFTATKGGGLVLRDQIIPNTNLRYQ